MGEAAVVESVVVPIVLASDVLDLGNGGVLEVVVVVVVVVDAIVGAVVMVVLVSDSVTVPALLEVVAVLKVPVEVVVDVVAETARGVVAVAVAIAVVAVVKVVKVVKVVGVSGAMFELLGVNGGTTAIGPKSAPFVETLATFAVPDMPNGHDLTLSTYSADLTSGTLIPTASSACALYAKCLPAWPPTTS